MAHATRRLLALPLGLALLALAGCGDKGGTGVAPGGGGNPQCADGATSFSSTFEGIQKVIFEQHGCTQEICHGSARSGDLDLSPDVAYQNIFDVPSSEGSLKRIEPGEKDRSYLWLKLAAKTDPTLLPAGYAIAGAAMPNNLPALSADELELLRLWIYSGAPETGTVEGTEKLLDACLPPAEPITIKPLDPPAPGTGVQFVLPTVHLPAHHEQEVCFATYYDVSAQVPAEMRDPSGQFFRYSGQELRQDPQSHHLVLLYANLPASMIHDPSFGAWTCAGGATPGATCEPTDLASCGTGICRSQVSPTVGCIGYGPASVGFSVFTQQMGGAQQTQAYAQFHQGVFAQIPMKGIAYWNSHAFNLTDQDHELNGRINFTFATDQRYPIVPILDYDHVFDPDAAPYTIGTYCGDYVAPQGMRLFGLTSHNHKHGKLFVAFAPDGTQIYESTIYNDPTKQNFPTPLAFDSPDPAERTIHYCGTFNNGVKPDGSPDPETVTRASRVPASAQQTIGACTPIACAGGKIGAPCNGVGDDRTCDSSPGANDGLCDACPITGGESTENEMFILLGQGYIDEHFPQPSDQGPLFGGIAAYRTDPPALDASGRSTYTGFATPPAIGCASTGHALHAAHPAHGS